MSKNKELQPEQSQFNTIHWSYMALTTAAELFNEVYQADDDLRFPVESIQVASDCFELYRSAVSQLEECVESGDLFVGDRDAYLMQVKQYQVFMMRSCQYLNKLALLAHDCKSSWSMDDYEKLKRASDYCESVMRLCLCRCFNLMSPAA